MISLITILLFPAERVFASTQCNTTLTVIPNNNAGGADVVVTYPQEGDVSSGVLDFNASVDITHPYVGDIDGNVTSPSATSVQLFDRPGYPPNWGCTGNNIQAMFDDEAASGTNVEAICAGATPTISGTYQPQNIGSNPLGDFDGTQPAGDWTFHYTDNRNSAGFDTGWSNQACVTIQHAAVTFDKWVSTNATCSDTLDSIIVTPGTNVYYCYTVSNPGTEQLVLDTGNATDDQGLDLSGLVGTYAPGASTTIVSGPYVAGGVQLPIGTTTNIAQVTMTGDSALFPNTQSLVTSETATVLVSNAPPASGNKPLYLDNANNLSRIAYVGGATATIDEGAAVDWVLPALSAPLTVDGTTGQVPVTLVLDELGNGSTRNFTISLISSDAGIGTFASGSFSVALPLTPTYNLALTTPGDKVLPDTSTITLRIDNTTTGSSNRRVIVTPNGSQVTLPSNTVVNVDSVYFYDTVLAKAVPGAAAGQPNVYVRADISDPFGWADVTSATVAMTGGPCSIGAATMTSVATTVSINTFQSDVTVTTVGNPATCTASVTGYEGYEVPASQVTHTNTGDLLVGTPSLTMLRSVAGVSKPGQTLTFSTTVTNSGSGYTNSISLAENVSPYVAFNLTALPPSTAPFTFSDGTPCGNASGLSLSAPQYANNRPPTYAYVPGVTGFDGTITAWRHPAVPGAGEVDDGATELLPTYDELENET
ncbi:MAG: hypothetical protein AMJ68_09480 [Acidithiobacillales bacterium SG8_45]|nr:MAG: hypothetical protein AMJ68_09480 [Acidithiobacillales bacterium SG8_45]